MKIQIGFLLAYDYKLLYNSIPPVYKEADEIFLAIDKSRKTWAGELFSIEKDFFNWLKKIDVAGKIRIYEDDFYLPHYSTMECEVRERRLLAQKMGIGNWILQLDADEYFVNFSGFASFLRANTKFLRDPVKTPVNISPFSVNLYKKVKGGFLVVDEPTKQWVATNMPEYVIGRKTRNPVLYHRSIMIHECLSRTREELKQKLENWGHNTDFDSNEFLRKWDMVDESNYMHMRNFFYLNPERWKKLTYVPGNSICELTANIQNKKHIYPSRPKLFVKNIPTPLRYLLVA